MSVSLCWPSKKSGAHVQAIGGAKNQNEKNRAAKHPERSKNFALGEVRRDVGNGLGYCSHGQSPGFHPGWGSGEHRTVTFQAIFARVKNGFRIVSLGPPTAGTFVALIG